MDTRKKIHYLQAIDIFQDLSKADMQQIDHSITMSSCQRGKVFYRPDEPNEVLFLLKKGRVQFYRLSAEGQKLVVDTIGPGTIFGDMEMVGQGMANTFAESLEECLLCIMSRQDIERLILHKPVVALRLLNIMADRLKKTEMQLEEVTFKSVPNRLAALLLRLQTKHGATIQGYTHQDLAEMLGTYRETITQALNEFKAAHLIAIGRKQIDILDESGLRAVAED